MCNILDAVLKKPTNEIDGSFSSEGISTNIEDQISVKSVDLSDEMEAIFILSLYSSLGAPLEGNSRLVFDEFVKKISGLIKVDDSASKRATFSNIYIYSFLSYIKY